MHKLYEALLLFELVTAGFDQRDLVLSVLKNWYSFSFRRSQVPVSGARGDVVVKALRYKPAGRWLDSPECYWNFSVT
jgi:hypothetical protein